MAVEIANMCANRATSNQREVFEESKCFFEKVEEHEDDDNFDYYSIDSFLKINVGGRSFWIRPINLARAKSSTLASFVRLTHEQRLQICHTFFEHSQEYYFERSGRLFESVFRFYTNGAMHRPMDVCLQEFMHEINFWGISPRRIAPCCAPKFIQKEEEEEEAETIYQTGSVRKRVWLFCEGDGSRASISFQMISIFFILVSILALILGSIPEFRVPIPGKIHQPNVTISPRSKDSFSEPHPFLTYTEVICIIYFTSEYLIRLALAPQKLEFMRELLNVVDLITIIPFYLELTLQIVGVDTEQLQDFKGAVMIIRILRVLRVVRILKLGRYSTGMKTFAMTMKNSARQLGIMAVVFLMCIVFFSTMVYFMEEDEPDTPFTSIPAGFWWCIVTMTTVGYGDVVPATIIGKLIGCGAILCGVLVLALPITIIVDNFTKVNQTANPFANLGSRKISINSARKASVSF